MWVISEDDKKLIHHLVHLCFRLWVIGPRPKDLDSHLTACVNAGTYTLDRRQYYLVVTRLSVPCAFPDVSKASVRTRILPFARYLSREIN